MNDEVKARNSWLREQAINYMRGDENLQKDISESADVHRKVLTRLVAGANITLENALPLIKFFTKKEELIPALKRFVPEIADALSDQLSSGYQVSHKSLNDLIKTDWIYHEIHGYASHEKGTSHEFVKEFLGSRGTMALKEMVDLGLIKQISEGHFQAVDTDTACTDIDTIVEKHCHRLKSFDADALREHQIGSISHSMEHVSPAGLKATRMLNGVFHTMFNRLKELPWFKGDIPMFYQSLVGPVNKYEASKIDKEEYKKIEVSIDEVLK